MYIYAYVCICLEILDIQWALSSSDGPCFQNKYNQPQKLWDGFEHYSTCLFNKFVSYKQHSYCRNRPKSTGFVMMMVLAKIPVCRA